MKAKSLIVSLAILIILTILMSVPVLAAAGGSSDASLAAAEKLHDLGLFRSNGYNTDGSAFFDLHRESNRLEGIAMFLRLIGEYDTAREGRFDCPFDDVWDLDDRAITGYAYAMGHTRGVSSNQFNPYSSMSAAQYLTFSLRALGYSEEAGDFQWNRSWEKTDSLGITHGRFSASNNTLLRGDVAEITLLLLEQNLKNSSMTLIESLIVSGVFDRLAAQGLVNDPAILAAIASGNSVEARERIVSFVSRAANDLRMLQGGSNPAPSAPVFTQPAPPAPSSPAQDGGYWSTPQQTQEALALTELRKELRDGVAKSNVDNLFVDIGDNNLINVITDNTARSLNSFLGDTGIMGVIMGTGSVNVRSVTIALQDGAVFDAANDSMEGFLLSLMNIAGQLSGRNISDANGMTITFAVTHRNDSSVRTATYFVDVRQAQQEELALAALRDALRKGVARSSVDGLVVNVGSNNAINVIADNRSMPLSSFLGNTGIMDVIIGTDNIDVRRVTIAMRNEPVIVVTNNGMLNWISSWMDVANRLRSRSLSDADGMSVTFEFTHRDIGATRTATYTVNVQ